MGLESISDPEEAEDEGVDDRARRRPFPSQIRISKYWEEVNTEKC